MPLNHFGLSPAIFSFIIALFLNNPATAQLFPIGLSEGMMGNSGLATFEPTAASYYNPSLLRHAKTGSITAGGNTLSVYNSNDLNAEFRSTAFSPAYLSSVQKFESFVHDFFIVRLLDLDSKVILQQSQGISQGTFALEFDRAGYSFAFPALAMGFQVYLDLVNSSGSFEAFNDQGVVKSISSSKTIYARKDLGASLSSDFQFDDYRFGARWNSRSIKLNSSINSSSNFYLYNQQNNTFTSETIKSSSSELYYPSGNNFTIGHGFRNGAHEFLTDSFFAEGSDLKHSYTWRQSYGYKLGLGEDHQFMCGMNHLISDKVKYFGQDAYYSVGYSWKTRSFRSGIGLFYLNQRVTTETSVYGLSFTSQFAY